MARIAGVDIPNEKRVEIGLTYIYGIGRKTSNDILTATGINPDTIRISIRKKRLPHCVKRLKNPTKWRVICAVTLH